MQIIEATAFGVRAAAIRLRSRDTPTTFVIYPMIHMGSRKFYADVAARLKTADVIVAEGVGRGSKRRPSVLAAALTLSYNVMRFNRRLDVVEQDIDYAAFDVPVVRPDVDIDEFRSSWRRIPVLDRLLLWCVLPVVMVVRLFGGTEAIWSKAVEVNDLPSDEDEAIAEHHPEVERAFGGERDERLLEALRTLHEERGHEAIEVAVVYGAGHVAAIVHGLHSRHGYIPRFGDWLTVIDLTDSPATPAPTPDRGQQVPARTATPPRPRPAVAEPVPTPVPPPPAPGPQPVGDGEAHAAKVARLRGLVAKAPDSYLGSLASALIAYSDHLADQARPEEALAAADEAMDISEDLTERFGASYHKTHARAAYTLGERLHDVGRSNDATALYAEAVEIFRTTHRNDPYERARSLATVLTDYAGHLEQQNLHEEAVAAAQEAIELFRTASAEVPDEFHHPWAFALRNLADALRSLNQTDAALQAAKRGVNIAGQLTKRKPQHGGILVDNLIRLARIHRDLDNTDDAVAAARDSVEAARALAVGKVLAEQDALARALTELATALGWAKQRPDAVAATAEAAAVWRAVAQAHPVYRPRFALALARYAFVQWHGSVGDFGLASAVEAEAVALDLVADNPEAHRMTRQQVIAWVWRSFYRQGQRQRAVELTEERVRILSEATAGEEVLAHAKEDRALALESSRPTEHAV